MMFRRIIKAPVLLALLLSFLLVACGGGGGGGGNPDDDPTINSSGEVPASSDSGGISGTGSGGNSYQVGGDVLKGPFRVGSQVLISFLDEDGNNTAATIVTKTVDDLGNFEFTSEETGIVQASAKGFYRNEVIGTAVSNSELTLRSVYKITEEAEQTSNINILTHITNDRIIDLIGSSNMSFEDAVSQVEAEFLDTFSIVIPNSSEDAFSSLSIYGKQNSTGSAYLLAFSTILYQYAIEQSEINFTNRDAELSILINEFEFDFRDNGVIDNVARLQAIRNVIPNINPIQINANINSWIEDGLDYVPADINEFLDTDLDGQFNAVDLDDDNDQIDDIFDPAPYTPNFAVSDQLVFTNEDESVDVDITANSPLGLTTVVTVIKQPENGSLDNVPTYPTITYTPDENFNGVDEFKYILSQDSVTSDIATVYINVGAVNDAPVITGSPSNQVSAGDTYSFTPDVLNIDNPDEDLTFSIINKPDWASFDESTGLLQGVVSNSDIGTYEDIEISVSDGEASDTLPLFSIQVIGDPWVQVSDELDGGFGISVAADGPNMYVSGGADYLVLSQVFNINKSLEVFNADLNTWQVLSDMPVEKAEHTSHVIDGQLYVLGGLLNTNTVSDTVEKYDIANDTWSTVASMSSPRMRSASCVYDDKIYIFGGLYFYNFNTDVNTAEVYDPVNDTWTAIATMPTNLHMHKCVTVNDRIYLFGGSVSGAAFNETKYVIYNPNLDSWETGGELNTTRGIFFDNVLLGDQVYFLSGVTGGPVFQPPSSSEILKDVTTFDPLDQSEEIKAPMKNARYVVDAVVYDGKIFVFSDGAVDVYDPQINTP